MYFLIQFLDGKNKELGRLQFWDGKKKGMTKSSIFFWMEGETE
jgi:hypothetical protein